MTNYNYCVKCNILFNLNCEKDMSLMSMHIKDNHNIISNINDINSEICSILKKIKDINIDNNSDIEVNKIIYLLNSTTKDIEINCNMYLIDIKNYVMGFDNERHKEKNFDDWNKIIYKIKTSNFKNQTILNNINKAIIYLNKLYKYTNNNIFDLDNKSKNLESYNIEKPFDITAFNKELNEYKQNCLLMEEKLNKIEEDNSKYFINQNNIYLLDILNKHLFNENYEGVFNIFHKDDNFIDDVINYITNMGIIYNKDKYSNYSLKTVFSLLNNEFQKDPDDLNNKNNTYKKNEFLKTICDFDLKLKSKDILVDLESFIVNNNTIKKIISIISKQIILDLTNLISKKIINSLKSDKLNQKIDTSIFNIFIKNIIRESKKNCNVLDLKSSNLSNNDVKYICVLLLNFNYKEVYLQNNNITNKGLNILLLSIFNNNKILKNLESIYLNNNSNITDILLENILEIINSYKKLNLQNFKDIKLIINIENNLINKKDTKTKKLLSQINVAKNGSKINIIL